MNSIAQIEVPVQRPGPRTFSDRPLYRVEYDGDFEGHRPLYDPDNWLHQGLKASGAWEAIGRWYSDAIETLDFYCLDVGANFRVFRIDATADECAAWSLEAQPEASRFSLDLRTEYFVSRDAADGSVRDGGMEAILRSRVFGALDRSV